MFLFDRLPNLAKLAMPIALTGEQGWRFVGFVAPPIPDAMRPDCSARDDSICENAVLLAKKHYCI
ncbi:MAG: hypothetical protein EOP38_04120 [Rubrivivax sp.]|nr:MAG: hypothetical protein EOP38_04120 [Rubrivivax sp.]